MTRDTLKMKDIASHQNTNTHHAPEIVYKGSPSPIALGGSDLQIIGPEYYDTIALNKFLEL